MLTLINKLIKLISLGGLLVGIPTNCLWPQGPNAAWHDLRKGAFPPKLGISLPERGLGEHTYLCTDMWASPVHVKDT